MKQIQLTQGKFALVDDDVYEWAKNYRWYAFNSRGMWYAVRNSSKKENPEGKQQILMLHHCIVGFPLNNQEVDHREGNGLNNQRDNLRVVTHRKNTQNKITHRNGHLLGATFNKRVGKWIARIQIEGKQKSLGYFKTKQEAHKVYVAAANRLI